MEGLKNQKLSYLSTVYSYLLYTLKFSSVTYFHEKSQNNTGMYEILKSFVALKAFVTVQCRRFY